MATGGGTADRDPGGTQAPGPTSNPLPPRQLPTHQPRRHGPLTKSAAKPSREALGRSRGGLTSKIHLAADTRCRPISRVTTAGHRHDSLAFEAVMARIKISRRGPGRPRTRPGHVMGDKAYPRHPLPPAATPDHRDHPRARRQAKEPAASW